MVNASFMARVEATSRECERLRGMLALSQASLLQLGEQSSSQQAQLAKLQGLAAQIMQLRGQSQDK